MKEPFRVSLLAAAALSLSACGGGGGAAGTALPSAASPAGWGATLRYVPTQVHLSMSSALVTYMYIDSGSTNGVYPSPSTFAAELGAANPGFPDGPCSKVARMSASVMQFTDTRGVQAPSYVVFFAPQTPGTCTQQVNLGAAGFQNFSVTVDP